MKRIEGRSLHCASGNVRMSEDHSASVRSHGSPHLSASLRNIFQLDVTEKAMRLECHGLEDSDVLCEAKLLRMKYPKVPSGAPEYCMPHSTWINECCQLGICDGTKPPKLLDTCLYLPKEQEPNMGRGDPKRKSVDGRGSCSVRQTCTRSCLQNDVNYAWCRR